MFDERKRYQTRTSLTNVDCRDDLSSDRAEFTNATETGGELRSEFILGLAHRNHFGRAQDILCSRAIAVHRTLVKNSLEASSRCKLLVVDEQSRASGFSSGDWSRMFSCYTPTQAVKITFD
jgi:hypothetical protein